MALADVQLRETALGGLMAAHGWVERSEIPWERTPDGAVSVWAYGASPKYVTSAEHPHVLVIVAISERREPLDAIANLLQGK